MKIKRLKKVEHFKYPMDKKLIAFYTTRAKFEDNLLKTLPLLMAIVVLYL
jgi:hypothetical protein